MIVFAVLLLMFSGVIFISMFTFIMHCRSLGIDPNLIANGFGKDIDVILSCKLSGLVAVISFGIVYEMISSHPFIHLGM